MNAPLAPAREAPHREPVSALFSWKEIVRPVEPFLEQVTAALAEQIQTFEPEVAVYAQYALKNQGKQLRPALVVLSAEASGRITDDLVIVAVIIEMVHLATLVHDDIIDDARVRRSQPTVAALWGNEISVLLGDCLFAQALKLAAEFNPKTICQAIANATKTVCSGEILQTLQRYKTDLTRADYCRVLAMKTGALFALSCDLGAALGGATESGRAALGQFGLRLGTAYQLYDDCLDLFGSETTVGKSLGTDLAHGKLTLPTLVVLERATPADRARVCALLHRKAPEDLPWLYQCFRRYDVLAECQNAIRSHLQSALSALDGTALTPSHSSLRRLTEFLAAQLETIGLSK